jgi:hypothetical protein
MVKKILDRNVRLLATTYYRNLTVGFGLLAMGTILFGGVLPASAFGYAVGLFVTAVVMFFVDFIYTTLTSLFADIDSGGEK